MPSGPFSRVSRQEKVSCNKREAMNLMAYARNSKSGTKSKVRGEPSTAARSKRTPTITKKIGIKKA